MFGLTCIGPLQGGLTPSFSPQLEACAYAVGGRLQTQVRPAIADKLMNLAAHLS